MQGHESLLTRPPELLALLLERGTRAVPAVAAAAGAGRAIQEVNVWRAVGRGARAELREVTVARSPAARRARRLQLCM